MWVMGWGIEDKGIVGLRRIGIMVVGERDEVMMIRRRCVINLVSMGVWVGGMKVMDEVVWRVGCIIKR